MVAVAGSIAVAATGCTRTIQCGAGSAPGFDLTVRTARAIEPAVRFCDEDQCSPVPGPGPIPEMYLDDSQNAPARIDHLSRGEWRISPRGAASTGREAPATATVELYEEGRRISSTTVRLEWPAVDPCAASNPPPPHPTITAR